MNRTFTVVNDTVLVESINAAQRKIVYIAPGISQPFAVALGNRFKELGKLSITLIMDIDPEVYRMGYGDPEGLDMIKNLPITIYWNYANNQVFALDCLFQMSKL